MYSGRLHLAKGNDTTLYVECGKTTPVHWLIREFSVFVCCQSNERKIIRSFLNGQRKGVECTFSKLCVSISGKVYTLNFSVFR